MKKLIEWIDDCPVVGIIFLLLAMVGGFAALMMKPASEVPGGRVITDLKTGCQYVVTDNSITPRMLPEGGQVCLKVVP